MSGHAVDPYGGPGGWAEGLLLLGLPEVGVELDPWACATRRAAGHPVIRADVTRFPLDHLTGRVEGLCISPPCQAFSTAGNGLGRDYTDELVADIHAGRWVTSHYPERVRHVLEVGRWVTALRPRWVAAEQVPPVLPLWDAYRQVLARLGYSTWAGVLCAADYGVPQTRRRAILMASLDRTVHPPAPTHTEGGASTLFGDLAPWVSMAEALGWTGEPAPTLTGIAGAKSQWVWERPATTVAGDPRITARCHHDDGTQGANAKTTDQVRAGDYDGTEPVRLTLTEALILQGFPPDYPVQGTKTAQFRQVGDAVPPPLAAAVVAALTGQAIEAAS